MMDATTSLQLVVTKIRQETALVKTLYLQSTDNSPLPYRAGQFITLIFGPKSDERRSYSFSSAPGVDAMAAITVKRIDNGRYSRQLIDTLQEGSIVEATVATGVFTLPEAEQGVTQLLFFAAGIGITPVFSLIKEVLATRPHIKILLVYSTRSIEDTVFYKELVALEQTHTLVFKIVFLFSTAKNLLRSRLSKEVLPELIEPYFDAATIPETACYVCGPHSYMRMVTWALEELHIPTAQIRREQFVTQHHVRPAAPPDTGAHEVTIHTAAKTHLIAVQYPVSILKAARAAGIQLPYSCETGQCGSCTAVCTKGKVWMSYNEVLTEKDIANGKVLTCTGFPLTDDVTISYQK